MDKGKILIVEDEKKIYEIVKAYLERDGYRVDVAETGEKALKLLKGSRLAQERIDLIILDLMLPDMEGEDICRAVREGAETPIIMLTAKSGEEDRVRGLGIGADDYVVKPFSPRELVARVNAQLRRTKKTGKKLSFAKGALTIDISNREVWKNAMPVTLTATEFGILLALTERPGRVLSRLQLVNIVQGYDFEGYERTIDAHIKNLRHKLEEDPKKPSFIQTVYGVGYKFIGTKDED
jgi:DNA-binding response OmpR family regulator